VSTRITGFARAIAGRIQISGRVLSPYLDRNGLYLADNGGALFAATFTNGGGRGKMPAALDTKGEL
jgi:hypothetical protein